MINSRAEPRAFVNGICARRFILPGLAATTLVVFATFAQAQAPSSGPVRLAPPVQLQPTENKSGKITPVTPPLMVVPPASTLTNVSTGPSKPAIEIDTLKTIDPDTAGILSADEGGFGPDLWLGTSDRFIETMLARLPVNVASTTMRDLMHRLLLTPATMPPGHAADGSEVVKRVGLLTEMGDVAAVSQLLDAIPGRGSIDQLVRYEADIRFLANDNARACALASAQIGKFDSSFWQKAFIFCQALAGERDKAALGVSLLQEVGDQDRAFFSLVNSLSGNKTPLESLPDPTPLHLSMARAAKVQLPADVVSSNNPGILRSIATSPNAPVAIRLEAAERAELAGALDVDTLRQLYTSVSFSEQDLASPLSKAEAESGALSRALLYSTALVQTVPTAQAEVVARALTLARKGGRYASTVRVFLPVLKKMPPTTEIVWFAPEIIRAFLVSGDAPSAQPWFALLKAKSLFDKDTVATLNALMPVAVLAGYEEETSRIPQQLAAWWKLNKGTEGGPEKAALLYSLFEGVGVGVPRVLWEELLDGPQRATVVMPSPALWDQLISATETATVSAPQPKPQVSEPEAATSLAAMPETLNALQTVSVGDVTALPEVQPEARKRVGEALLLSLVAIGEGGPGAAAPVVLKQVIGGLRAIGLEREARALALEAAVAAGL